MFKSFLEKFVYSIAIVATAATIVYANTSNAIITDSGGYKLNGGIDSGNMARTVEMQPSTSNSQAGYFKVYVMSSTSTIGTVAQGAGGTSAWLTKLDPTGTNNDVDANITNASLPVTQSGTWNIGTVTTLPAVTQGTSPWVVSANGGTFAVTQSGAWTVAATQSGTWNINSITTLPAIAISQTTTNNDVDANITNATLAVTQSGGWTVTANQGTSPWVTADNHSISAPLQVSESYDSASSLGSTLAVAGICVAAPTSALSGRRSVFITNTSTTKILYWTPNNAACTTAGQPIYPSGWASIPAGPNNVVYVIGESGYSTTIPITEFK